MRRGGPRTAAAGGLVALALLSGATACSDDSADVAGRQDEAAELPEPDLVAVARLLSHPADTPDCGSQHFGVAMPYQVERVVEGRYERGRIYVIHGCPELPRVEYGDAAGELSGFKPGAFHRLELARRRPAPLRAVSVIDELGDPSLVRWWALRADPAR